MYIGIMDLGREVFYMYRNLFTLMKSLTALFIVYCHIFFELRSLGNYYMLKVAKQNCGSISGSNPKSIYTELKLVFFFLKMK
jgi:hypothetical protein